MAAHPERHESPRIQQLKQEAKEMKAQGRARKHHLALKAIAAREGFASWEELVASDTQENGQQPTEAQVRDAERRAITYGMPR